MRPYGFLPRDCVARVSQFVPVFLPFTYAVKLQMFNFSDWMDFASTSCLDVRSFGVLRFANVGKPGFRKAWSYPVQ